MITKIKNRLSKLTAKDWIAISLWILAFVLLLAFVISAAVIDHSSSEVREVAQQTHLVDKPDDVYDPVAKAFVKATPSLDAGKHTWDMAQHKENFALYNKETYANALAGIGSVFAIALIAAMFVTTWFSYTKKKGVGK